MIRDPRLKSSFYIEFTFNSVCTRCDSYMPIEQLCPHCQRAVESEVPHWQLMNAIVEANKYPTSADELCGSNKMRQQAVGRVKLV
ncbi:MAG: hypothetical protein P4M11_15255 [Candidatus Pacebacteria bacterium]|nr:hypothetical protein [Candidatus Paceibacterota bacterium]